MFIFGLEQLRQHAPKIDVSEHPRIVIFSDFHMGNGSSRDDFRKNNRLVQSALEEFYLSREYSLVLNGDVEDIQKYRYKRIQKAWPDMYRIFHAFKEKGRLFKTVGNHDWLLHTLAHKYTDFPLLPALRIGWKDHEFFIFHGHQARRMYDLFQPMITLGLRFIAAPLGVKNYTIAHDSEKKFRMEKRVYNYSRQQRIASVIGHTHRPLFESLSKRDMMIYRLEYLLRKLHAAPSAEKKGIEKRIKKYRERIEQIAGLGEHTSLLYSELIPVPCLFNSGCGIGKRGVTCLEIVDDQISLVHWYDEHVKRNYVKPSGHDPEVLPGTSVHRMVIKQDSLSYIFSCIDLLS